MARAKSKPAKPAKGASLEARVAELELLVREKDEKLEHEQKAIEKLRAELEVARQRNPPASAPPKSLADMAPPPEDPLAAADYAYKIMMFSLHDAATDTKINSRERRKEMRTIAAAAAKLLPRSRIYRAEQLVLGNDQKLQEKAQEKRGAKLEKRVQEPHP